MRRLSLLVAGPLTALAMAGCGGGEAGVELPPAREPRGDAGTPSRLVMIGDSLAVGTEPLLPRLLAGWTVTQDVENGRVLDEGMAILARTRLGEAPVVLAFSLFTNDDPSRADELEAAVRESVARAGRRGCAVWATIARPSYGGASYDAVNARLQALAAELPGRLRVVPWAEGVAANPSWLTADGVHATAAGYGARARMYADAARSCRA